MVAVLYWATIVMIRAAGTVVGDWFAERDHLGLAMSTVATGVVFVALLAAWRRAARRNPAAARAG
jgi:uncharacterized membrane-anchored protein